MNIQAPHLRSTSTRARYLARFLLKLMVCGRKWFEPIASDHMAGAKKKHQSRLPAVRQRSPRIRTASKLHPLRSEQSQTCMEEA